MTSLSEDVSSEAVRKVRVWLALFIAGLILSGITAFPLQSEVHGLALVLQKSPLRQIANATGLLPWVQRVQIGLEATNSRYPFLAYGTDWLAFAHLVVALVFVGPYLDPVRNRWVITFGLIACAAVPVLAFTAGPVRGIPLGWRLVDSSFGVIGAIPLLRCRSLIEQLESKMR